MNRREVILIKIIICVFWGARKIFDKRERILNIPWADVISIHPWSKFFWSVWLVFKGKGIIAWEDRGAKNHIEDKALWFIMDFNNEEVLDDR